MTRGHLTMTWVVCFVILSCFGPRCVIRGTAFMKMASSRDNVVPRESTWSSGRRRRDGPRCSAQAARSRVSCARRSRPGTRTVPESSTPKNLSARSGAAVSKSTMRPRINWSITTTARASRGGLATARSTTWTWSRSSGRRASRGVPELGIVSRGDDHATPPQVPPLHGDGEGERVSRQ